jgi:hypothetical protein
LVSIQLILLFIKLNFIDEAVKNLKLIFKKSLQEEISV